jgi:hypothetical protein
MPNVDFTQFDHVQEREQFDHVQEREETAEPAPAGRPTEIDSELKWD